jgi:hypothetical protein
LVTARFLSREIVVEPIPVCVTPFRESVVDGDVEFLGPHVGRARRDICIDALSPETVPWPVREGDIVRLNREPDSAELESGDETATITEVLVKSRPRFLSAVDCRSAGQLYRLIALAEVLRAEVMQVRYIDHPYAIQVWVMHAEDVDLSAIARAAGLTRVALRPPSPPCHLCKIPFFTSGQRDRMIALAVFLGAEVLYATDHLHAVRSANADVEAEDAEEEGNAGEDRELRQADEVVLFHGDDIDIRAVADAAGVTRDPKKVELGIRFETPPPGAEPGAEWQSGTWG